MHQSCSVAVANRATKHGLEVIVFIASTDEEISAAMATLDHRGQPRWAVVSPPWDASPRAESAPADEEVALLGNAIRVAVESLVLRRENARLRGDLSTIGRRLAHDLRTPLNSIAMANTALAEPAVAADLAPHFHRSIKDAVSDSESLLQRVGVVLLASARPLALEPVDMEEIVWNARQQLDERIRFVGASVIAPPTWPVVSGVPSLLELIWVNLISNSLEHGGPSPRIEVGWQRGNAETRFWIRDSGPGVAFGHRSRLFYPLDRLSEFNAPRGYGLPLVHRLVELQAGTTGYVPEPAPGGTFYFTLL